MARLVVARVLGEDPWKAEPIEVREGLAPGVAEKVFERKLEELEARGYECYDHGAAEAQLCVKIVDELRGRVDRLLVKLEPEPSDHLHMLRILGVA